MAKKIKYRNRLIYTWLTKDVTEQLLLMLVVCIITGLIFYCILMCASASPLPDSVRGWGWWIYANMIEGGNVMGALRDDINNKWIIGIGLLMSLINIVIFGGIIVPVITNFFESSSQNVKTGKCRYKISEKHYVILGWDVVGASIVHKLIKEHKPIVILSQRDPEEIRGDIDSYDEAESDLSDSKYLYILNGSFTNPAELESKTLALDCAEKIYVLGEKDSIRRDNDTIYAAVDNECIEKKCKNKGVELVANIRSFTIYSQIKNISFSKTDKTLINKYGEMKNEEIEDRTAVDVNVFNFYENWARKIWSSVDDKYGYLPLAYKPVNKDNFVHLIIIGFGQMGVALAVEAARVAHYGIGKNTRITIIDDKLDAQKKQFVSVFKLKKKTGGSELEMYSCYKDENIETYSWREEETGYDADVDFSFIDKRAEDEETTEFLKNIAKESHDGKQIPTLAVTFSDLDAALDVTLSLPIEYTSSDIPILLRNENDSATSKFGLQKAKCTWGEVKFFGNLKDCTDIDYDMETFAIVLNALYSIYEDCKKHEDGTPYTPDDYWEITSEYNRWSSRHQAFAFIERLRSIGYRFTKTESMRKTSDVLDKNDIYAGDKAEYILQAIQQLAEVYLDEYHKKGDTNHAEGVKRLEDIVEIIKRNQEDCLWETIGKEIYGKYFEHYCKAEHDRWSAEKWLDGWTYSDERNNKIRKHNDLRDYKDLSPEEQAKDIRPLALSKWLLENYCGVSVTGKPEV